MHSVHLRPLSFLLLALSLLIGCESSDETNKMRSDKAPPTVRVIRFGDEQQDPQLSFTGTIQENRLVPIAFQVGGRTTAVQVENGDTVGAGQILAKLDTASLADAWRMAHAKFVQAEDAYNRMKPLHDSGATTEVQWVEMTANRAQAEAMASLSRRNLEDAVLRAPVGGIVIHRNLEVGQTVAPGQPVLGLVDARYLDAVFAVAETEIGKIRPGAAVNVSFPDNDQEALPGKVGSIAVSADAVSRSYEVRVRLSNPQGLLRMGMACQGVIALDAADSDSRWVLPLQAVLENADGSRYVYVLENSTVKQRTIDVAGFLGKGLRVRKGLQPGDLVVSEGVHGLSEGITVNVMDRRTNAR